MTMVTPSGEQWSSRFTFILAAVGAAVGLGRPDHVNPCFQLFVDAIAAPNQRMPDKLPQFVLGKGFLHVIHGAVLHALHRGFDGGETGNDDDVDIRAQVLHGLGHVCARHGRHLQVGEHEVVVACLDQPQGLLPGFDRIDAVAVQHQDLAEAVEHHFLVVDAEDARRRFLDRDTLQRF